MEDRACRIDDGAGAAPEASGPESGWRRLLGRSFGIDTRTLALFRVGAALLILFDLATRVQDLGTFYAGGGAYGLGALLETVGPLHAMLSVYYWAAPFPFLVWLLFAAAAVFALFLLIGYRTRLFTLLSWYMLLALHIRNPEVIGGGDSLFRLLLFWSIFVPLGARWSVDAAVNTAPDRDRRSILSVGSAALLLQLAFMYWFSVLMKFGPSWWTGEALGRALQMDFLIEWPGLWLRQHPELTRWMTHGTLALEALGPLVVFSPFWTARIRLIVIPIFVLFHLGISASMMVGFFPYATILGWLLFVPGEFWDALQRRLDTRARRNAIVYYDEDCGFCKRMVGLIRAMLLHPATRAVPAQSDPEIERLMREHNSWVLVDPSGRRHFRYGAFIRLCRISPLWPIAYPLSIALAPVGRPAYRWVAQHRDLAGSLAFFLKPRRIGLSPRRLPQAVAGVLLAYVLFQNLGECGEAHATYLARGIPPVESILRQARRAGVSEFQLEERFESVSRARRHMRRAEKGRELVLAMDQGSDRPFVVIRMAGVAARMEEHQFVSDALPGWIYALGRSVNPPVWMRQAGGLLMLSQRWTLFAPEPRMADMWYVWSGMVEDGRRVDLWRMRWGVDYDEPSLAERDIPTMRWHAFLAHPPQPDAPGARLRIRNMVDWAVDRWNARHTGAERVVRADLYLVTEKIGEDGTGPVREVLLGSFRN